jgi:hypothetical protein
MCPSRVTCLPADCCFSELALSKYNYKACWSSTKQTLSSFHWKLTCSCHYIAEKMREKEKLYSFMTVSFLNINIINMKLKDTSCYIITLPMHYRFEKGKHSLKNKLIRLHFCQSLHWKPSLFYYTKKYFLNIDHGFFFIDIVSTCVDFSSTWFITLQTIVRQHKQPFHAADDAHLPSSSDCDCVRK